MKKTVINYGLYGLLTGAIFFLLAILLGKDLDYATQEIIGYTTMIVSLIFVFFGILHYRNKVNNGKVSFAKAFQIGIFISLIAGLGFGIVDYLYTTVINPDFAQEYLTRNIATMEATLSPEDVKIQKAALEQQMKDYGGSGFMALIMFASVVIIGLIISLISSLILQRK